MRAFVRFLAIASLLAPLIAPQPTLAFDPSKVPPITLGTGSQGDVSSTVAAPNAAAAAGTLASFFAGGTPMQGLNVVRPAGTLAPAIFTSQTPSGISNGSAQLNRIVINGGDVNTGTGPGAFGFVEGVVMEQHFPGPLGAAGSWSGGVNGLSFYLFRDRPTPANSNNTNYVAGTFTSEAVTTDGGTSSTTYQFNGTRWVAGAKGAHFGINAQSGLQEDATNIFNLTGAEFNLYSRYATAQLSTTQGSTTATYTGLAGKIGYGQVVYADTTQVPASATLISVSPGLNGSGTVVLSTPALKTATQAVQLRPSVAIKTGIQITGRSDDIVNGDIVDAMISLSGQFGAKWRNGLLFGDQNGSYPLAFTATVIGTKGAGTVANVIDFSGYTVTGSLMKGQKTNLTDGVLFLTGLNSGVELGSMSQAGLGLVDGHSSGSANDYDARIQFYGGTSVNGQGKIAFLGAGVVMPFGTPANSNAPCDQGEMRSDAGYVYTCAAPNTWRRVATSTW